MSTSRAARSLLALPARSSICPRSPLAPTQVLLPHTITRTLSTSSPVKVDESPRNKGLFKSILHGSEAAKKDGPVASKSHSQTVGRGKYIHEIQRHVVRPDKVDEYIALTREYYPKLAADGSVPCRLVGSWQVHIGDLETFYHIWEYDGYGGYDTSDIALSSSEEYKTFTNKIRQTLASRSNWLTQEFAFWATAAAHESSTPNPIYELRTYHLKPGMLLEWESNWRRGLEARKRFVEPIAAYFSQIGTLHTVQHIWRYDSLEQRKATRDAAWQVETWNDTVTKTVKLIDKMHAQIMKPLPWSPLK